jgi:hypothetical protein
MGSTTSDGIHYKLEKISNILRKKYVLKNPREERDWRTYKQEFAQGATSNCTDYDFPYILIKSKINTLLEVVS